MLYKHTVLRHLYGEINTSPRFKLAFSCLCNGKIRVKHRNEEVLSDSLADFVFLCVTPFWKENHFREWWAWWLGSSAAGGDGAWSLQLASSILGLLRSAARVPLLGNPLQFHPSAFSAGRKDVNRLCSYPESLLLSSFMCVCVVCKHTRACEPFHTWPCGWQLYASKSSSSLVFLQHSAICSTFPETLGFSSSFTVWVKLTGRTLQWELQDPMSGVWGHRAGQQTPPDPSALFWGWHLQEWPWWNESVILVYFKKASAITH